MPTLLLNSYPWIHGLLFHVKDLSLYPYLIIKSLSLSYIYYKETMEDLNQLTLALVKKKKTNKWLVEWLNVPQLFPNGVQIPIGQI